jgi:hypothetical protein
MTKTRSPSYPAIGLKEAVDRIQMVYNNDYQNEIPRIVAAQHMGYAGFSGKSLGVLSALVKFGLLEGRGESSRVSDLAVKIIAHPTGTPERTTALIEAASKPDLFAEIEVRFPGPKKSDQAIRSYLLTEKFIPSAADAAIRSYRETKQFVESQSMGYTEPDASEQQSTPSQPSALGLMIRDVGNSMLSIGKPMTETVQQNPMKVAFNGERLEITAYLSDADSVDKLIKVLEANKPLLPEKPKSDSQPN